MKTTLLALVAILCLTFAASAADISGKWTRDMTAAPGGGGGGGGRGGAGQTYTFKVAGATLTGTIAGGRGGDIEITDGKMINDTFSFSISQTGQDGTVAKIAYTGKVVGDKLELTFDNGRGRGPQTTTLKRAE